MPLNPTEIAAALEVVASVGAAIRDLQEVPSGHLYAQLCGVMSLDTYLRVVNVLKNANLVREIHNCLVWVGPVPEKN
jgi:hypothetical protein